MGDYLATNAVHIGSVLDLAGRLEPASVQTIITSPPYWGLRSYLDAAHPDKAHELGSEATPEEFVANLVAVFAALRPALKDDGTLWLNLGDSYANDTKWGGATGGKHAAGVHGATGIGRARVSTGVPPKSLLMIPHRVALALQADGWVVRSDIVWAKPNPMPESVTDRPTKAHEYLFLIAKSPQYFYDADAIKEPNSAGAIERFGKNPKLTPNTKYAGMAGQSLAAAAQYMPEWLPNGRNKRSVWTVPSAAFPDAHYATFPPDLIRPCVLAGTSQRGECSACGKAWVRTTERESNWQERKAAGAWAGNVGVSASYQNGVHGAGMSHDLGGGRVRHTGWAPQCRCEAPTRPQVVLDPFMGSGTTAEVAHEEGRRWVGLDLDERAARWTADRLARLPVGRLFA